METPLGSLNIPSRWGSARAVSWVIVGAMLLATVALWLSIRNREDTRAFDRGVSWAENIRNAVAEQVSTLGGSLRWNESFFTTNAKVSQESFATFNQSLHLHSPAMAVLEWAPRVWAKDRAAYEAGRIWPGVRPSAILNPVGDGSFREAEQASYYLPITYGFARSGNEAALGMNIAFSIDRRIMYERAGRDGIAFSSGVIPVYLSTYAPPVPGLVRSRPVYDRVAMDSPEARWRHLKGWVSTVVNLEALFQSAIDPNVTEDFNVFVVQSDEQGTQVIGYRTRTGNSSASLPREPFRFVEQDFLQSISVDDQTWMLVVRPTDKWLTSQSHLESTLALAVGIVVTCFVGLTLERKRRYDGRLNAMHKDVAAAKERTDAANVHLQMTVEELHRTRESLVQSEKLASLGVMVAGLSHELNTPIGNALLAGTSLKAKLDDLHGRFLSGGMTKSALQQFFDEAPAACELFIRSTTTAATLITNFKQWAADQATGARHAFALKDLVNDCVGATLSDTSDMQLNVSLNVPDHIKMESFPATLEQVLKHVLTNSVVHGFEGRTSGHITISAHQEPGTPAYVSIEVEDDGCGIEPAHLQHLFDPFYTTRMGRNSGIGLNVVYRLVVNVLGGEVKVHSRPQEGTRFILRLPMTAPALL